MTECGTPQGYTEGCRGANCANHRTDLMTCTQAHIRYQGDYPYRKQVDAGTATAEREVFITTAQSTRGAEKEKPHGTTRAQQRACQSDCPNAAAGGLSCAQQMEMVRATEKEIRLESAGPITHGTTGGYSGGCHKASPCPGGERGMTCTEVMNEYQRDARHRRRQNALKAERMAAQHVTSTAALAAEKS